ncbi:MAG: MarR family transcriptional regulator [Candidatus Aminicenantes bacterium]|nr:MarR family transcriptional regulator [Candidatus Aminicenantes bacterium]
MNDEKLLNIFSSLVERYSDAKDSIRKGAGLTGAEFKGLMCLKIDEKISCQDLSGRMNISVSRGSRIIEGLFTKGFLERTDSPTDRRCKNVWLTNSGAQVRRRMEAQIHECEERLTANLPPNRLENLKNELLNLLKKF